MKIKRVYVSVGFAVLVLVLIAVLVTFAQGDQAAKPYLEGEGAVGSGRSVTFASEQDRTEGKAGATGRHVNMTTEEALKARQAPAGLSLLYRFTGVSDDGEQGSANRREATSIHCTNVSASDVSLEMQIFQWNGTDVFTGTVSMPPNRTFTFSTQNTTIYFDDLILGGGTGTDAIFQGSGQIWTDASGVICTAQVLDPLNYPPDFATTLDLFGP